MRLRAASARVYYNSARRIGADANARSLSVVSADRNRRISRSGGRLFAFMNNMIILINGSRV